MQNKFPGWTKFRFPLVYEFSFSLYGEDIKFKSHFWPQPNLTEKIEFLSTISQCEFSLNYGTLSGILKILTKSELYLIGDSLRFDFSFVSSR